LLASLSTEIWAETTPSSLNFVTRTARKLLDTKIDYKQSLIIKLLFPKEGGFIIRSDLLTARLAGCKLVHIVEHFVLPGQMYEVPEFQVSDQESLFQVTPPMKPDAVLTRS
jgi:hypothetical protein